MTSNSIVVIQPYKDRGTWVFDDPRVGLVREPFVCGIPAILGEATKDIPDAAAGFRLLFSAQSFPGYTVKLERVRPEWGGTWYRCAELNIEGWLCPALFLYYSEAPPCLYAKAEGL